MHWMILYGTVTAAYTVLFLLSVAAGRKGDGKRGGKGKKGGPFLRMGEYLYEKSGMEKLLYKKRTEKDFSLLYPGCKIDGQVKKHYIHKISLVLLLGFAGNTAAICCLLSNSYNGVLSDGKYIGRNPFGEGNIEAKLQAEIWADGEEGPEGRNRKKTAGKEDFILSVQEQQYGKEEVKRLAKEAAELLPGLMIGKNRSQEEVREDLNLVQSLEDYPFHISWESSNYERVYSDGTVLNTELKEPGETVELTAVLSYDGYQEEHIFTVFVRPPIYTEEIKRKMKIDEALKAQEENSRYEQELVLPAAIDGMHILWHEKKKDSSRMILLLSAAAAVMVYIAQDNKLHEKVRERERQLLLDYPSLVSKLALYMGAGMTIRNAFERIAGNYAGERKKGLKYRFAYEEMLLSCHELSSGIPETAVYENFGRRCRLPPYTKLVNLLVQNLRKGSNSLLAALRQEAEEAFEERKNMARMLGEEAGTKLLFPMMLMLGVVMLLIIIPAYYSFSI